MRPIRSRNRIVSSHGYVKIRVGIGHPLADSRGFAYEHDVIWRSAWRLKRAAEHLHHVNGDRQDNRIGNLKLMHSGDHKAHHAKGQRRDKYGKFAI